MATNIATMTIVKRFTYRGDNNEEFSNTYHFLGAVPTTDAEWLSMANGIIGHEEPIYDGAVTFVRAIGHDSTDPGAIAKFDHDFTSPGPPPAGTFVGTGGVHGAGDQAACVEWLTDRKTSRGKPIYLRKYHHRPFLNSGALDSLEISYYNALDTYAKVFVGNAFEGGLTNPEKTATVVTEKILQYVTTRTLKRRGKRKKVA
jgi:hypothetical protein